MADGPRISVVVPAFDAARPCGATLASILTRRISDLEVLVVDDGSTDDTAAIAERAAPADDRVVIVDYGAQPQVVPRRGTRGSARSSGEWVAMVDADDLGRRRSLRADRSPRPVVPRRRAGHRRSHRMAARRRGDDPRRAPLRRTPHVAGGRTAPPATAAATSRTGSGTSISSSAATSASRAGATLPDGHVDVGGPRRST